MMLRVFPLNDTKKDDFLKLFTDYYAELGCDDDAFHLVEEYILPDMLAGLIRIDLVEDGGRLCGFVIYQIDDINNEWNVFEGRGDVREIYISPDFRGRGTGRFLLYTAEMKLKEAGAKEAYCLPSATSEGFFKACGYSDSGKYMEELDCNVYEKKNLNNCCK